MDFDHEIESLFDYDSYDRSVSWIDLFGNPAKSANEMTADHKKARLVEEGEACGKLTDLVFRDPDNFKAGELHNNYIYWEEISTEPPPQSTKRYLDGYETRSPLHHIFVILKETLKGSPITRADRPLKRSKTAIRHASLSLSLYRKPLSIASNVVQSP